MKDGICGIGPQKAHVNLIFLRGTELDDPQKLLEGTGKKGRHVKIKKINEIDSKDLKFLIIKAANLTKS